MAMQKPIIFAGNDYLGLSEDPRVAQAMMAAAKKHGIGPRSGRFFIGWTDYHKKLESNLAEFFGTEDACLLGAAYLGGLVYFSVMAGEHKTVFCDEYSHCNLFQGMRSAGFKIHKFRHLDAGDLEAKLKKYKGAPPIVATDGVFGISGEAAPVKELARICRRRGAELFVDDAHGVFAMGRGGRGTAEWAGVKPNDVTVLGSMSKALGVHGGFFVGRKDVMRRLQKASAGSSPAPIPVMAACLESLRRVREDSSLRGRMWANAGRMREILAAAGVKVVSEQTPVVTLSLRDEQEAVRLAKHLESRGLLIRYCKYPAEPRENLLRSSARACHTEKDLKRFERAVKEFFG